MKFKKYNSIENSYREPYIEKVRETLDFLVVQICFSLYQRKLAADIIKRKF